MQVKRYSLFVMAWIFIVLLGTTCLWSLSAGFLLKYVKTQHKIKDASYVYAWMNSLSRWVRPSAGSLGDCSVFYPCSQVQLQFCLHRPTRWIPHFPNLVVSLPFSQFSVFFCLLRWEFSVFQLPLNIMIPWLSVINFHIRYLVCLIRRFAYSCQHKWSHHQFLRIFPSRG